MSKYIVRHNAAERVMHWTLVVSFFILVLTGLGLYAHSFFGYLNFFGGAEQGMLFHRWASILFIISSVYLFLGNIKETLTFDADDAAWLKAGGGYLSREKKELPQGKFNAGQKLFAVFAIFSTVVMAVSGFVIWFADSFGRALVQFSLMIHALFFIFFVVAAIVHIYLASIGNPGTSSGMLWGQVTRGWAKKHSSKWYKAMGGE
jgi:formate dehydrogenase subunit gamma